MNSPDASDAELAGPMDSSDEEEAPANVTAVETAVSSDDLIARARRAGNMNGKDKNTPATAKRSNNVGRSDGSNKRKEPPTIDLSNDNIAMAKTHKKLNSQMFPKDIRPDWLEDDETIDELTRAEALQTISQ